MKLNYVFFGVFCRILHGNRCELYRCFIGILYKRLFSIYIAVYYILPNYCIYNYKFSVCIRFSIYGKASFNVPVLQQ